MSQPPDLQSLEVSAQELTKKARGEQGSPIGLFKDFLKVEEERLHEWHKAGGGGREIARQRSDIVDILVRELFEGVVREVATKPLAGRLCVMAFGGYGRRELTPMSDIDILFLQDKETRDKEAEEIIRRTIVALWDIGFKVGQATRTVAEAIEKSNEDMVTKTSMLESRYLVGDRDIFTRFKERFQRECIHGREQEYISWRLANQNELRTKYGQSVFMQEPNIKSGTGSLRDYQSLLWISQFKLGINSTAKLVEWKILRDADRKRLDKSYDFLLRTRAEMQYLNGRSADQLTLQLQGRVAQAFDYPQKNILRKVESFMRDYYGHARTIFLVTEAALGKMEARSAPEPSSLFRLLRAKPKTEKFDRFLVRHGQLIPESREIFNDDPYRLLRAFHHAQIRQLEFHPELVDLISRRLHLIDRTFQYSASARETFFAILSRKGEVGRILRLMHNLGVLGRYIPEFGTLDCLVQHEFYHRYTADEHTLVCIEKLDSVLFSDQRRLQGYRPIFQKLEDPSILYLSVLLHDTGKAANTRHHEEAGALLAHKVARRLQLPPERRRMLITLVDSHYTLSKMSQTRNLEDPATTEEFARIVGNRKNLDALMLLTLADGMGTSDENWSDWKEGLVWTLYRRTARYLEGGVDAMEETRRNRLLQKKLVLDELDESFADESEAHFHFMPDRYFQMFEPGEIASHLRHFREFFLQRATNENLAAAPALRWIPKPDKGHTEVWVCSWDRPRLLERIAGAFVSARLNILGADIFTRTDSLALDIFRVCGGNFEPVPSPRDVASVEKRLTEALDCEEFDFTPLMDKDSRLRSYKLSQEFDLPTRITIDNDSHPVYTLIEIQTPDRLGLLYDLLRAMSTESVLIEISRITTEMDVAMDSFYVYGRDGGKITSRTAIRNLQQVLHNAAVKTSE
jgi:[protein-PII] uridylyltransferase